VSVTVNEAPAAMPYEGRDALVALMYRMFTTHLASRTLILMPTYQKEFPLDGWDGEVVVQRFEDATRLEQHAPSSFERVALHWVLDEVGRGLGRRRARARELALLRAVRRVLVPGGRVAGLAANLLVLGEREGRPVLGRTSGACRQLLRDAGFDDPGVSIAMPSGDNPRSIISTSRRASRHYFQRQLDFNRGEVSFARHLLQRRLVIRTGLARCLQGSLLFSGRAP
jgi:hypothetical protein